MNESTLDGSPSAVPLLTHTGTEAGLLDKLADLLVAASDVVTIARELGAPCSDPALSVETRATRIYEDVRALLEELAD